MLMPSISRAPIRWRTLVSTGFLAGSLFLILLATGCVNEDDLTTDQRVYQLSQQLMCPVCDGQTLDQSQAQISLDMQAVIERKVEEGESNAEIRDYFVARYGEVVLASPDAGGFNIIAWVMPVIIFLGGALLVGNAFMNMRRKRRGDASRDEDVEVTDPTLEPMPPSEVMDEFLERADKEIAAVVGDPRPRVATNADDRDRS